MRAFVVCDQPVPGTQKWPRFLAGGTGRRKSRWERRTTEDISGELCVTGRSRYSVAEATLAGRTLRGLSYHSFDRSTKQQALSSCRSGKTRTVKWCYCVGQDNITSDSTV